MSTEDPCIARVPPYTATIRALAAVSGLLALIIVCTVWFTATTATLVLITVCAGLIFVFGAVIFFLPNRYKPVEMQESSASPTTPPPQMERDVDASRELDQAPWGVKVIGIVN